MSSEDLKVFKNISDNTEIATQIMLVYNIECKKRCKNIVLNNSMLKEYGLSRIDLVASFIEIFYRKGKEDALKELKEKL
jgi:hypothetical protein